MDAGEDETTGTHVLLIYNHWQKNLRFWKPSFKHHKDAHYLLTEADLAPTQMNIDQVNILLATVFNLTYNKLPKPTQVFNHAWHEAPYWLGWHSESPGYNLSKIQEDMRQPIKNKGKYITMVSVTCGLFHVSMYQHVNFNVDILFKSFLGPQILNILQNIRFSIINNRK